MIRINVTIGALKYKSIYKINIYATRLLLKYVNNSVNRQKLKSNLFLENVKKTNNKNTIMFIHT